MELQEFKKAILCFVVARYAIDILYASAIISILISTIMYEIYFTPVTIACAAVAYLLDQYLMRLVIDSGFVDECARIAREIDHDQD